ncbi:31068_t:CDS:2, partial [Racocetra persica]
LMTSSTSTSLINKRKKFISLISQQQIIEPLTIRLLVIEELETYLSLPIIESGTSISCEEVFSIASITISKLYNCLDPETACALLCLKYWMKND